LSRQGWTTTIDVRDRGDLPESIEIDQGSFRCMPAHGRLGLTRIPWRKSCDGLNEFHR
jgi:hypothetical protein